MFKCKYLLVVLLAVLLLSACTPEVLRECPLPPTEFSKSDLTGVWGGTIDKVWDSTIIIREDGQYRQIVNVEWQKFKYESDWKSWHITYSDRGLPYLHLEGFLMCAYWRQVDCRTGNTGITPITVGDTRDVFADVTYWYDGCQKKWVDTPGEGVFMVFGVPRASVMPPHGITLVPFTKSSDGGGGVDYELREP